MVISIIKKGDNMATITTSQQSMTTIVADVTYADTGTVSMGNLPPGAVVQDIKVFATAAWDSSTSDVMTIGHGAFGSTSADVDEFEASIDIQATGLIALTPLQLGVVLSSTDNVPLTFTITNTGTGLSAGALTIMLTYVQK